MRDVGIPKPQQDKGVLSNIPYDHQIYRQQDSNKSNLKTHQFHRILYNPSNVSGGNLSSTGAA